MSGVGTEAQARRAAGAIEIRHVELARSALGSQKVYLAWEVAKRYIPHGSAVDGGLDKVVNQDEYCKLLGGLVANFQSLEFSIRAYLYEKADPPHTPLAPGQTLTSLKAGDVLPENALTDFSSLGQLIDRYNKLVEAHPDIQVDRSVVSIRDALAHGRVSTLDLAKDYDLLKFDKPSNGNAKIAYSQPLTEDWLKEQIMRVLGEIKKLARAPGSTMQFVR